MANRFLHIIIAFFRLRAMKNPAWKISKKLKKLDALYFHDKSDYTTFLKTSTAQPFIPVAAIYVLN